MLGALLLHGARALGWVPPKIVIDAHDYTHLSSGVRCLHVLCDRLNALGINSAITARIVDPRLMTPRISRKALRWAPSILGDAIVIYPEVTRGNPLQAKHVARYLLNKPGQFDGRGSEILKSYRGTDFFIHFAEEFRPAGLQSTPLRLPLIDTSVFAPPASAHPRSGFLVYNHRYRPDIDTFPDWVKPLTIISRATPLDPITLARLYGQSRALITGERTAAVPEALHCNCPAIFLPHNGFNYEPVVSFFGGHGIAVGFDRDGLIQATKSAPAFASYYAAQFNDVDQQIRECVAGMGRHFGLGALSVP